MKLTKKTYIIGGAALFTVLLAVLLFFTVCGPARFFHRDFSGHVLKKMDRRVAKLELSKEQSQKYKKMRQDIAADLDQHKEQRRMFFTRLQNEISKENPDIKSLTAFVKDHAKNIPGFVSANVDRFEEFYNILDKGQKSQLIKRVRKKVNRIGKCVSRD